MVADGSRDEIFSGHRDIVEQVGIRPPEIFSMGQRAGQPGALCYTIDEFTEQHFRREVLEQMDGKISKKAVGKYFG